MCTPFPLTAFMHIAVGHRLGVGKCCTQCVGVLVGDPEGADDDGDADGPVVGLWLGLNVTAQGVVFPVYVSSAPSDVKKASAA